MTTAKLIGMVRRHLGVRANEAPDSEITVHLVSSLTWLAEELEHDVRTEEMVGLEADQQTVPLPESLLYVIYVELNDTRLDPISPSELDREGSWRTVDSGTPTRYAVQGRNLILNPPISSDSLTDDDTLTWCWIGSGERLPASGPVGLSTADQELLAYDAAIAWLSDHPSDTNLQKISAFTAQVNRRLPAARKRWQQPVDANFPQIVTDAMARGPAR